MGDDEGLVETIPYNGYEIGVFRDLDPGNPRTDRSQVGVFTFLGEWQHISDINAERRAGGIGEDRSYVDVDPKYAYDSVETLKENILQKHPGALLFPVMAAQTQGGTTHIYFESDLDRANGIIYVPKEVAIKEWGGKSGRLDKTVREKTRKYIEGEVQEYEDWSDGEVYGYMVRVPGGKWEGGVWGFWPEHDKGGRTEEELGYMLSEAKAEVDGMGPIEKKVKVDAVKESERLIARAREVREKAGLGAPDTCPWCGSSSVKG